MPKFVFTELVNSPMADIKSACLGDGSVSYKSETDLGKLVKLGTEQNYVLAAEGDEIDGFIFSVEPMTYNDGVSFGSVQQNKRHTVTAGTGGVSVGDYVVAGAQAGPGVEGDPVVITGTPTVLVWRVIRIINGTGAEGDSVLIERV